MIITSDYFVSVFVHAENCIHVADSCVEKKRTSWCEQGTLRTIFFQPLQNACRKTYVSAPWREQSLSHSHSIQN